MQHCHREADGTGSRRFLTGGDHGLILDVSCQFVVELQLFTVQIKCSRAYIAFGEQLMNFAGLRIWKRDECFLGSPQVKRSLMFAKCLLQTFDASVDVRIQQSKEPSKVFGVAFVRCRCHQQKVVCHLGERFAKAIGVRLPVIGRSAHLVGFIDNDQIPTRPQEAFTGIFNNGNPGHRRNHLIAFLPWILPIVGA